jgi:3-hydroxyacyl-[acyl-carrier-protein] dehydratase
MFNPADYDIRRPLYDKAKIREHNAQRYEMEVLDGVLCYDREKEIIGGFYRLEEDSWWARGHFPDRPMLPGVLALEATGQLCSIYFHEHSAGLRMGIAKIGEVRYLRPMLPPNVLYLGARLVQKKLKFAQFAFQGIIDGKVAFFGEFTGGAV